MIEGYQLPFIVAHLLAWRQDGAGVILDEQYEEKDDSIILINERIPVNKKSDRKLPPVPYRCAPHRVAVKWCGRNDGGTTPFLA